MDFRVFKNSILLISFFFCGSLVMLSQNVVVQISEDTIQIGDPVSIEFIIDPGNGSVEAVNLEVLDSIPSMAPRQGADGEKEYYEADFELLNGGNWKLPEDLGMIEGDALNWSKQEGQNELRNKLSFTIWNEGIYFLPSIPIRFKQGNSTFVRRTNALPLFVGSPLVDAAVQNDSIALSDIKPIIEEPIKFEDYLPYIGLGILLLHLICLIYFLATNKKREEILPIPVIQIMPNELAEEKFDRLSKAKLWQQGSIKDYLSQLTFILREYLENRFDIPALESTTGQILRKVKSQNLSENLQSKLEEMLQISDLVKFAKAQPKPEFLENAMKDAESFVQVTKENGELIWVERAKYRQLKGSEEGALQILGETMRVTQNLEELTNPKRLIYATFWERLAARLLDFLFYGLIVGLFITGFRSVKAVPLDITNLDFMMPVIGFVIISSWLYFAYMEWQKDATFGKMLLGIRVGNYEGESISAIQASFRWLGRMFSDLLVFIGNFWFYFDKDKRQTLYDRFGKTIVIKK